MSSQRGEDSALEAPSPPARPPTPLPAASRSRRRQAVEQALEGALRCALHATIGPWLFALCLAGVLLCRLVGAAAAAAGGAHGARDRRRGAGEALDEVPAAPDPGSLAIATLVDDAPGQVAEAFSILAATAVSEPATPDAPAAPPGRSATPAATRLGAGGVAAVPHSPAVWPPSFQGSRPFSHASRHARRLRAAQRRAARLRRASACLGHLGHRRPTACLRRTGPAVLACEAAASRNGASDASTAVHGSRSASPQPAAGTAAAGAHPTSPAALVLALLPRATSAPLSNSSGHGRGSGGGAGQAEAAPTAQELEAWVAVCCGAAPGRGPAPCALIRDGSGPLHLPAPHAPAHCGAWRAPCHARPGTWGGAPQQGLRGLLPLQGASLAGSGPAASSTAQDAG